MGLTAVLQAPHLAPAGVPEARRPPHTVLFSGPEQPSSATTGVVDGPECTPAHAPLPSDHARRKPVAHKGCRSDAEYPASVVGRSVGGAAFSQREASSIATRAAAAASLGLQDAGELQDYLASLVLSECVYKKVEVSSGQLAGILSEYTNQFPPGWLNLEAVQVSVDSIEQHYIIATGGDSMYVAFMGTKQARDVVADVHVLHKPVWAEAVALAKDRQSIPSAHTGFLQRARSIDIGSLYDLATASGKKLVLCGHSLGGAVAKLCTLQLLRELPQWTSPNLSCICFATPAIGNSALASLVVSAGWAPYFKTYFLPEDQLIRIVSVIQPKSVTRSAARNDTSPSPSASAVPSPDLCTASSPPRVPEAVQAPLPSPSTPESGVGVGSMAVSLVSRCFSSLTASRRGSSASSPSSLSSSLSSRSSLSLSEAELSHPALPNSQLYNTSIDMSAEDEDAVEAALDHILSASASLSPSLSSPSLSTKIQAASLPHSPLCAQPQHSASSLVTPSATFASAAVASAGLHAPPPPTHPSLHEPPPPPAQRRRLNLALALVLERKKLFRRLRRLARRMHVSLPRLPFELPANSGFHAFGTHMFLFAPAGNPPLHAPAAGGGPSRQPATAGAKGASAGAEAEAKGRDGSGSHEAASGGQGTASTAGAAGLHAGPFNYHRMIAYRLRTLELIRLHLPAPQSSQASANDAAAHTDSTAVTLTPGSPPPVALRPLIPTVSVTSAVARLPLDLMLHVDRSDSDDDNDGDEKVARAPFLLRGGGKAKSTESDMVTLDVQVEGTNFHFNRLVSAKLDAGPGGAASSMGATTSLALEAHVADMTRVPAGAIAAGPSRGRPVDEAPQCSLRPASVLTRMTGYLSRSHTTGPSGGGGGVEDTNDPCHMTVRISVPRASLASLVDASVASRKPVHRRGRSSSRISALPQPPQQSIVLRLSNDFEEVTAAVQLLPYRIAIWGTSSLASSLVHSVLRGPAGIARSGAAPKPAAASSAAASCAASGARSAPWWWPQPVRWATELREGLMGAAQRSTSDRRQALVDGAEGMVHGAQRATSSCQQALMDGVEDASEGLMSAAQGTPIRQAFMKGAETGGFELSDALVLSGAECTDSYTDSETEAILTPKPLHALRNQRTDRYINSETEATQTERAGTSAAVPLPAGPRSSSLSTPIPGSNLLRCLGQAACSSLSSSLSSSPPQRPSLAVHALPVGLGTHVESDVTNSKGKLWQPRKEAVWNLSANVVKADSTLREGKTVASSKTETCTEAGVQLDVRAVRIDELAPLLALSVSDQCGMECSETQPLMRGCDTRAQGIVGISALPVSSASCGSESEFPKPVDGRPSGRPGSETKPVDGKPPGSAGCDVVRRPATARSVYWGHSFYAASRVASRQQPALNDKPNPCLNPCLSVDTGSPPWHPLPLRSYCLNLVRWSQLLARYRQSALSSEGRATSPRTTSRWRPFRMYRLQIARLRQLLSSRRMPRTASHSDGLGSLATATNQLGMSRTASNPDSLHVLGSHATATSQRGFTRAASHSDRLPSLESPTARQVQFNAGPELGAKTHALVARKGAHALAGPPADLACDMAAIGIPPLAVAAGQDDTGTSLGGISNSADASNSLPSPTTSSEEPHTASSEVPRTASSEVPCTASSEVPYTASSEVPYTASSEVPYTASSEVQLSTSSWRALRAYRMQLSRLGQMVSLRRWRRRPMLASSAASSAASSHVGGALSSDVPLRRTARYCPLRPVNIMQYVWLGSRGARMLLYTLASAGAPALSELTRQQLPPQTPQLQGVNRHNRHLTTAKGSPLAIATTRMAAVAGSLTPKTAPLSMGGSHLEQLVMGFEGGALPTLSRKITPSPTIGCLAYMGIHPVPQHGRCVLVRALSEPLLTLSNPSTHNDAHSHNNTHSNNHGTHTHNNAHAHNNSTHTHNANTNTMIQSKASFGGAREDVQDAVRDADAGSTAVGHPPAGAGVAVLLCRTASKESLHDFVAGNVASSPPSSPFPAHASPSRTSSAAPTFHVHTSAPTCPVHTSAPACPVHTSGPTCPVSQSLEGPLLLHDVMAAAPMVSPFVLLRVLMAAIRQQALLKRPWWRHMVCSIAQLLRPATSLMCMYHFVRGLPLWWMKAIRHVVDLNLAQNWSALLVAVSVRDSIRALQGRDFAALVAHAASAKVALQPVLITSPDTPAFLLASRLDLLSRVCNLPASAVSVVTVADSALQRASKRQQAAATTHGSSSSVPLGDCTVEGALALRKALYRLLADSKGDAAWC